MVLYTYWTQRLYAYILRKVIGPYLEESSLQKLHQSINEVSIQDGIYCFTDLQLNTQYLSDLVCETGIGIRLATIHRLEIQLSLQEATTSSTSGTTVNNNSGSGFTSLAWKAIQLGYSTGTTDQEGDVNNQTYYGGGPVAFLARIRIDGITIELEPAVKRRKKNSTTNATTSSSQNVEIINEEEKRSDDLSDTDKKKSMLSSYIDTILKSLRLSIDIQRLFVRFNSTCRTSKSSSQSQTPQYDEMTESESWIQLRIYSCSFHDSEDHITKNDDHTMQNSGYRTKYYKALSFNDRITIVTGDRVPMLVEQKPSSSSSLRTNWILGGGIGALRNQQQQYQLIDDNISMIAELSTSTGTSHKQSNQHEIALRVIEYDSITKVIGDGNQIQPNMQQKKRLQHDISITLQQAINILIDSKSAEQIQIVANAFIATSQVNAEVVEMECNNEITGTPANNNENVDEIDTVGDDSVESDIINDWNDIQALIWKQYEEARALAEKKEVTGGMLFPTVNGYSPDGTPDITYDAFFDANDGGFSEYATNLRESVMMYSTHHNANKIVPSEEDLCLFKFRFHLKEGGFKISFKQRSHATVGGMTSPRVDEYILLTFSDMNISSSISTLSTNHMLTISHVDIEDSCITQPSNDNEDGGVAEIGTILRFNNSSISGTNGPLDDHGDDDYDDYDEEEADGFVIQSTPCILLKINTKTNQLDTSKEKNINIRDSNKVSNEDLCTASSSTDIELTFEPIELTYRESTISKMISIFHGISKRQQKLLSDDTSKTRKGSVDTRIPVAVDVTENANSPTESSLMLSITCESIVIEIMLPQQDVRWSALYNRCGYEMKRSDSLSFMSKSIIPSSTLPGPPSIGILLDNFSFAMKDQRTNFETSGRISLVSCYNVIIYATDVADNKRFDILALCGRTEIDPYIPLSIEVWEPLTPSTSTEGMNGSVGDLRDKDNRASRSVPKVLPISSFKARQADDDSDEEDTGFHDDEHPEWVVSMPSKPHTNGVKYTDKSTNHIDWRATRTDPQHRMEKEAALSDILVTVSIPEVVCDMSIDELQILSQMISNLKPKKVGDENQDANDDCFVDSSDIVVNESISSSNQTGQSIAFTMACDFVSVAIHGDVPSTIGTRPQNICTKVSYCLNIDQFKIHAFLFNNFVFRHSRILLHDLNFLEVSNLVRPLPSPNVQSIRDRIYMLNERGRAHSGTFATPLVYRSHLFSPISRTNPSLLLDILNAAPISDKADEHSYSQTNVYFTAYDLTYRFNFDSLWFKRVQSLLARFEHKSEDSDSGQNSEPSAMTRTLTRVFLTVADCNIDYCSPTRFPTASRAILRVGDVRISSNIVNPKPSVQAFNLSIGDISVYVCNSRFPYYYENRHLLRSELLMRFDETSLQPIGLSSDCDAADVLRVMNYRPIVDFDTIDANISVSLIQPQLPLDPYTAVNLKLGELRISSCKDSFSCFVSTIGEISAEVSAINDSALEALKAMSSDRESTGGELEIFYDSITDKDSNTDPEECLLFHSVADLAQGNPSLLQISTPVAQSDFLLDGYDWTTIDMNKSNACNIPDGEEQSARWYSDVSPVDNVMEPARAEIGFLSGVGNDASLLTSKETRTGPRIVPHHFPLQPVSDPIGDGDMGAMKYAGIGRQPQVQTRVIIHDFAAKVVFFDGYDWPELLDNGLRTGGKDSAFVIPEVGAKREEDVESNQAQLQDDSEMRRLERKKKLMGDLLSFSDDDQSPFSNIPLAEERSKKLISEAELRRLSRNAGKYLQFGLTGVTLRIDSFPDTRDHKLASCLNFKAQDFMLAETISTGRPVRMAGEWINEKDHPRDSRDGLFMMKMVTWHPSVRVSPDNKVINDEAEATLKILPLRCVLDQRAIAFARALFHSDNQKEESDTSLPAGLHSIPPPMFRVFRMRGFKVKVDYIPSKLNTQALRDGALVELVNLSPIDSMVLTLQNATIQNEIGFGSVISIIISRWVQDICATQITKFLTNARPFEPITQVSGAAVDLVVLPWDAFKNGKSIQKALRAGTKSFSETLISEAFTVTSRAAQFVAGKISKLALGDHFIPNRPHGPPKGIIEATPHAVASISRGLQAANYKIIIIPYREYRRSGAKGAVTSVLKGIPIAVAAPASGAAEALSFALLAARNQIRPDIRKEEESIQLRYHLFDK